MRLRGSYVTAALIAAAVGLWLVSGQVGPGTGSEAPPAVPTAATAAAERPLPRVRVREVRAEERVRDVVVRGETRPSRQVTLRAETTGRVLELPVREGTQVEAGQELVRLDGDDREARLAEARALLDQRRLEYEQASQLAAEDFASRSRVAEARAALDAARARLSAAEIELARTRIGAPFAGVLDGVAVEVGDYITPGTDLGTLLDLDPLVVAGEVTEREVAAIAIGAPAAARIGDGRRVEGRVTYVAAQARPGTRTYPVEISVANPEGIVAGQSAEMHLPTRAVRAHLVPPSALTLNDSGEIGIKTVDNDGTVAFHPVMILGDGAEGVWLGGLPDVARVIIVGQEYVAAGQPVQPVPDQSIEG